ncbi:hypothetical protein ABZ249_12115 [Nocardiopsis sp. NPDC006139]|uniref:hypothetical protein n=1 Tax=Nocardiopsis sp. NPDC006139 TaxID=3154578 RepID=UPI0033AF16F5
MRGITTAPTPAGQAMARLRQAARGAGLRVQASGEDVYLARFGHRVRVDSTDAGRYWLLTLEDGTRRYPRDEDGARALAEAATAAVSARADRARTRMVRPSRTARLEELR